MYLFISVFSCRIVARKRSSIWTACLCILYEIQKRMTLEVNMLRWELNFQYSCWFWQILNSAKIVKPHSSLLCTNPVLCGRRDSLSLNWITLLTAVSCHGVQCRRGETGHTMFFATMHHHILSLTLEDLDYYIAARYLASWYQVESAVRRAPKSGSDMRKTCSFPW